MSKKRIKLGLALGAGAARGLIHIGVLKVLHKHGIKPHYIAGTSMGSVIGAAYAAGNSPEDLEKIATTTDWKKIIDFTIPKSGILKGDLVEKRINEIVKGKEFKDLDIKFGAVSYNLTKRERVVFTEGNLARALRASISIPGVFTPPIINGDRYIDGVVTDPTPFDVVQDMGADVVIAVDLYNKEKRVKAPKVKKGSFFEDLRQEFVVVELLNIKNYLFPERWPRLIRKILYWLFDKILYPAKVLRILSGKQVPDITQIMNSSIEILSNSYANERMKHADIDFKIAPKIKDIDWADFDQAEKFIKIGERAMKKEIPRLKKKLKLV
ncbi:patatin-like phospholipase family protein [Candidatus Woesearchaeota archaeon]|jgi:NTE family protein|nr:patatin-like phospholipase family protein [Candidatus Woesearchaeota archaeon]MBT4150411.1 patatin-like phospholipase family protein [Candidatus Woesearchaeota archaeon]MBT4434534.1 patatin-like phospholipase family protein [Candidatus Woesearchaeota archaeon]MBT7331720.1 patatin-like phospholipase family protein [Candidatus Woesearchaeota archaeon]